MEARVGDIVFVVARVQEVSSDGDKVRVMIPNSTSDGKTFRVSQDKVAISVRRIYLGDEVLYKGERATVDKELEGSQFLLDMHRRAGDYEIAKMSEVEHANREGLHHVVEIDRYEIRKFEMEDVSEKQTPKQDDDFQQAEIANITRSSSTGHMAMDRSETKVQEAPSEEIQDNADFIVEEDKFEVIGNVEGSRVQFDRKEHSANQEAAAEESAQESELDDSSDDLNAMVDSQEDNVHLATFEEPADDNRLEPSHEAEKTENAAEADAPAIYENAQMAEAVPAEDPTPEVIATEDQHSDPSAEPTPSPKTQMAPETDHEPVATPEPMDPEQAARLDAIKKQVLESEGLRDEEADDGSEAEDRTDQNYDDVMKRAEQMFPKS